MSWVGAWLGATVLADDVDVEPEPPDPIPVPIVYGSVTPVDHVEHALDRLPEQFKRLLR